MGEAAGLGAEAAGAAGGATVGLEAEAAGAVGGVAAGLGAEAVGAGAVAVAAGFSLCNPSFSRILLKILMSNPFARVQDGLERQR